MCVRPRFIPIRDARNFPQCPQASRHQLLYISELICQVVEHVVKEWQGNVNCSAEELFRRFMRHIVVHTSAASTSSGTEPTRSASWTASVYHACSCSSLLRTSWRVLMTVSTYRYALQMSEALRWRLLVSPLV